ncbi:hypothetical protein [Robertkochia aurantiaca]|uniref:hypothetical protein n=1 Tax=Robertkochia aurantiaca TaxID=2873700 RepID=UPI001CCCB30C|nr:hypothetical protein [Robertkochia sp. 3YJGBD-33]
MTEQINAIQSKFHHLAQFLASFNNSFLEKKPDDSQSSLSWSIAESALFSKSVEGVLLELNYPDIMMRMHGGDRTLEVDLLGLEKSGIDAWLRESLSQFSLDAGRLNHDNGYSLNTEFDTFISVDSDEEKMILQLVEERNIAQKALQEIGEHLSNMKHSPVRVWPHHFDTGMLSYAESGDHSKGLSMGYTIADNIYHLPYFYASSLADKDAEKTKGMPPPGDGKWVSSDNWRGAILPTDSSFDLTAVKNFYREFAEIISG